VGRGFSAILAKKRMFEMELSPVKKYTARYPDKQQAGLDQLLDRHKPDCWKKSGAALLLRSALAASQLAWHSGKSLPDPQQGST